MGDYKNIGLKIKSARQERGISQEALAKALGCTPSAISYYENNQRKISLTDLRTLAQFLKKPLSFFLEGLTDPRLEEETLKSLLEAERASAQAQIREEVERKLNRAKAIHALGRELTSFLDPIKLLHTTLDYAKGAFGCEGSLIILSQAIIEHSGLEEKLIDKISSIKPEKHLSVWIGKDFSPLCIIDTKRDQNHISKIIREYGYFSYLGVPLTIKGKLLGIFGIFSKTAQSFLYEDIEFLTSLAHQVSIALQNAKLYTQLQHEHEKVKRLNRRLKNVKAK
jgi:GAF domain-containing protein